MTEFSELGLAEPILAALARQNYSTPTPIQAQAIPHLLQGRDLLGIAQTGTGKTAAFALPILNGLAAVKTRRRPGAARALVLSPTRELASQIADSFRVYGAELDLAIEVVFGGVKHGPQARFLRAGLDVLVATPGRLLDHMEEGTIDLAHTGVFVLDEADQMFDLGFIKPLRRIAAKLPPKRQNLFFSATMPAEIAALAADLLRDPVTVSVKPQSTTAERIRQEVLFVEQARKRALLAELFADPSFARTLVFTKTKHGADKVTRFLAQGGVSAAAIHGNKSQPQRERALAAFKAGKVRALVATDIAARGIDVDNVTHVVNYDLPNVPESYVHRIGRTARAGADGSAVSLVANEERGLLKDIERVTRQQIPARDRRRDDALAALDAAISAAAPRPEPEEDRAPRPQPHHRSAPSAKRKPRVKFAARSEGGGRSPEGQRSAPAARPDGAKRAQEARGPDKRSQEKRSQDGRSGQAGRGHERREGAASGEPAGGFRGRRRHKRAAWSNY